MKKPYLECARLLVFLLFAGPLFSQINFAPYGSPAGFRVFDLVEVTDNELFIGCTGGIFHSTDAGDSWLPASQGVSNYSWDKAEIYLEFAVSTGGAVFLQHDYLYRFNPATNRWDQLSAPAFSHIATDNQNQPGGYFLRF